MTEPVTTFLRLVAATLRDAGDQCSQAVGAGHQLDSALDRGALSQPDSVRLAAGLLESIPPSASDALDGAGELMGGHDFSAALAHVSEHRDAMPWKPSGRVPTTDIASLVDFNAAVDLEPLTVGMVAVAAGETYPEHSHPPHEIYLVLTGHGGKWRYGGAEDYRTVGPGSVFYNPPDVTHGLVADEATLAFWLLWSD